jgi:hypothetical protein
MMTRNKWTNSVWVLIAVMCSALAAAPGSTQAQERWARRAGVEPCR